MNIQLDPKRLWKLDAAAQLAGLTTELLASAIAHGDIPDVELVELGPRKIRHVRAEPFLNWLEGKRSKQPHAEPSDLFAAEVQA